MGAVSFTVDPTGPGDPEGRGCEGSARGDFSALWLSCLSLCCRGLVTTGPCWGTTETRKLKAFGRPSQATPQTDCKAQAPKAISIVKFLDSVAMKHHLRQSPALPAGLHL